MSRSKGVYSTRMGLSSSTVGGLDASSEDNAQPTRPEVSTVVAGDSAGKGRRRRDPRLVTSTSVYRRDETNGFDGF